MTAGGTESAQGVRLPIGRDAELTELEARLDALGQGQPVFVEVVGEPGIGKTTLLTALRERADRRGLLVLAGRASQFELETPFDPFVDALDDYLATVNPRRLEPLGEDRITELAVAFPSLAAVAGQRPHLPPEERYRVHRAVRSLLGLVAATKPVVLTIDDAHWSDQSSLELLRHLVRRPPAGPVMVAIAWRTGTMPESWRGLSDTANRERELTRIEVGPLGRREAETLLGARVDDPELRAKLYETAGGNPFFLGQVAEAPEVAASMGAAVREREGVPRAVIDAIAEEVASLDAAAREALQSAAVAGDPFDPGLAASAAGIPESELLPSLDELARRGLVRRGSSPREFHFRHPLVWQGVYEATPAGWRIAAHGRLADALAARGGGAAARAPHIEAAAQPGDRGAVAVLREAADTAVATAPASAIHWYEAALRLLPADPGLAQERLALLGALAKALGSIGRLEESRDRLRETLELVPPEAEAVRVELIVAQATMENMLRRVVEGKRLLTETLASLGDSRSEQAAQILLALTTLHLFEFEREEVLRWAREATELAAELGMRHIEAAATGTVSYNEARLGNVSEALALLDRATPMMDTLKESHDPAAFYWVSVAGMYVERLEDSIRHADRARELARASDQGLWLPQVACVRAFALWMLGRINEACASAEEGIEMAQLTGNRQYEATACNAGALVLATAGRRSEAIQCAERALELSGDLDYLSAYARQNAAYVALATGDPNRARRLVLDNIDTYGIPPSEVVWQPLGLGVITEAELELGNVDAAARYARASLEITEGAGLAIRHSWARHGVASVHLARGESAMALEMARDAADLALQGGSRIDEGRALALAGRALAAVGDEEGGVAELRRAHDLFASRGAIQFRDAAARELRRLGVRVGRAGRAQNGGGTALSDREREIAELVAEGRSNKEIGAALFISPKTVEKHLARAFEKLGVSKRAQVAAAIAREREEGAAPIRLGK